MFSSNGISIEGLGQCPLPITAHDTVQLAHGSGGRMMNDLIRDLFVWAFDDQELRRLEDCATVSADTSRLAFSTDSFVVDPVFFPGGNIGELAVYGTVNDVAMSGARPLYLSVGMILEEGLPLDDLRRIVVSMREAADRAGVRIVTGDTKVVNKGKGDRIFINTSGIGLLERSFAIGMKQIAADDRILISGSIADHGMAILSKREGLAFETPIESDTAPLNGLIGELLDSVGDAVHAMRDPTRGGLAATLNEFSVASGLEIQIDESTLPVKPPVAGACEFLGLDPLYVANEGKVVVAVAPDRAQEALSVMKNHPLGRDAALVGTVRPGRPGLVTMHTRIGGWRIVDMLVGEQLPRIC
jgi:hydrogenase expression/formation protein HypE